MVVSIFNDVIGPVMRGASSSHLSCANMAPAGFDPVIPFDEVVDAARRVADRMPRELRCTSLGGLATTNTAIRIQTRLAHQKTGCGAGCECGARQHARHRSAWPVPTS